MFKARFLFIFVILFGCVDREAKASFGKRLDKSTAHLVSFQEKLNNLIQEKLIDFAVKYYWDFKELEKTYTLDRAKGDATIEAMWNTFKAGGILEDVVNFIITYDETLKGLSAKDLILVRQDIARNLEAVILVTMKQQCFLSSTIYHRVHTV